MIEKIDGLGNVRGSQPVKRSSKSGSTSGAGFATHMDGSSESAASASIGSTNPVNGILNIQEVDDALARAAKGKLRAEDILSKLDDMRLDLLGGGMSKEKLQQLSRVVNARRTEVSDPKLASILDDIDLRAQVELAKYSP